MKRDGPAGTSNGAAAIEGRYQELPNGLPKEGDWLECGNVLSQQGGMHAASVCDARAPTDGASTLAGDSESEEVDEEDAAAAGGLARKKKIEKNTRKRQRKAERRGSCRSRRSTRTSSSSGRQTKPGAPTSMPPQRSGAPCRQTRGAGARCSR